MPSIIEALAQEHRALCDLFDHIDKTLSMMPLPELKVLARQMEDLLLRHSAAEDDLVLLALYQAPEHRRRYTLFHKEHLEIDSRLTQIHTEKRVEFARNFMRRVMAYSRRHFQREEQTVFPLIKEVMGEDMLCKLGKVWALREKNRQFKLSHLRLPNATPPGAETRISPR
jgi:hemerythrin-like domain-containing protein